MRVLLTIAVVFVFASCLFNGGKRITGSGTTASEQRAVSDFTGVEVAGPYDVFVTQGTEFTVRVEGDANLLQYITVEKDGSVLEIGSRNGFNLRPKNGIKIYVTAPRLDELQVAGSGSIVGQTKLTAEALKISIGGSGDVRLAEVDAPEVRSDIGGSGSVHLKGRTQNFYADVAGSGEIHAFDLLSESTHVDIAGSGNAAVFASKTLDVNIAGSGDVQYKGAPAVKQNKAGSGSVRKAE